MDILTELYENKLVVFGILFPLCWWLLTRNYSYWKRRGVPYVKSYPLLGSLYVYFGKNLEDVEVERYNKCGKIYGHFEGWTPLISVGEPELIKQILVKDFSSFTERRRMELSDPIMDKVLISVHGEDWKRIRSIVSPTFSTSKLKKLMRIFSESSKTVVRNIKMESVKDESVDVLRIYGAFTMDVIASSAFSTKIDSHNDPENIFIQMARKLLNPGWKFFVFLMIPKIVKYFRIPIVDKKCRDFFKQVTLEIIEERRNKGETREDFLQLLIDAASEAAKEEKSEEKTDTITANYGDPASSHSIPKGTIVKHLSTDELVAQCIVFFIGGYHTTSATLGIATHLLAVHQNEQERLFNEINEVLSETEGKLTYEAMQKMKHLDNIVSETVRLYPPAIRTERTAVVDYPLGDTGIVVTKGMIVGIPIYAMHRDPNFFPEPEKFNPDRFTPEGREKQVPYTYLPFGAGPRNCVGMRFALMEIKVCLIHIFSVFHVQLSSKSKVPLEFGKGMGLLTPKPIYLKLTPRNDCPLKE